MATTRKTKAARRAARATCVLRLRDPRVRKLLASALAAFDSREVMYLVMRARELHRAST